jgi:integrase
MMTVLRQEDVDDAAFTEDAPAPLALVPARSNLATIDFEREFETAQMYAAKRLAPSTLTAYAADWADWAAWADSHDYETLPALAGAVATYLPTLHEQPSPRRVIRGLAGGMRANSIARRLAAIKHYHKAAGYASPTDDPKVLAVVAGIVREKAALGETVRRVDPIMSEEMRAILAPLGRSPRDVRDRALLLVNFRGALRRSELAALRRSDVTTTADALLVRIRKSKTDKTGAGATVPVKTEASDDALNPALALDAWLAIAPAGNGESPLFCSLHGSKTGKALLPAAIATIIQRRCAAAGVLGDFSGHSLRRGWIQSANEEGISVPDIQQVTRQKTVTMVAIYCENNDKRKLARRLRDGL